MATFKLPEGVEVELKFYLTSDKLDANVVIRLGGMTSFADSWADVVVDVNKIATANMLDKLADDWRVMSREEIAQYKKDEEAEKASEDEDEE